jgi:CheY-like chemotaxis protein
MTNPENIKKEAPTILCVDDDIDCLCVLRALFEREGYIVVTAGCAEVALKLTLSGFHLIMLDYEMPQMNGRDLFLRFRNAGVTCPIILLSGSLDLLPRHTSVLFSACVPKGGPTRELIQVVKSFLGQSTIQD